MGVIKLIIAGIAFFTFFALALYFFPTNSLITRIENRILPCSTPISYSLGTFDSRFGLTPREFLNSVQKAESLWETAAHRELFRNASSGALTINLVYDSRQGNTEQLQKLGIALGDDRASYDQLREKYDTAKLSYQTQKAALDAEVATYKSAEKSYNERVARWNAEGGAPRREFQSFQNEEAALRTSYDAIQSAQKTINETVATINALALAINQLAAILNENAAAYNAIGDTEGKSFEEGIYQSSPTGQTITIYQFNDKTKLVRVLAHELGHALGLGHVANPKSIMYFANEAGNEKLSAEDMAALKKQCSLP